MFLSRDEIRKYAAMFSQKVIAQNWHREEAHAQPFLIEFLKVFGVDFNALLQNQSADFEYKVPVDDGHKGYIDFIWKKKILVEMKSRGKDLDEAMKQARDYFYGLPGDDIPPLIMVSDFDNIWLEIRERRKIYKFPTKDLSLKIQLFADLAGYEEYKNYDDKPQIEVNVKAAKIMANLHDDLKKYGYDTHELEVYLVRILFCLFAEDTGIFNEGTFENYIKNSKDDGTDLRTRIDELFEVLNTPQDSKIREGLSPDLRDFRYINGKLFEEPLRKPVFNAEMRKMLIKCTDFNWSNISPAVFGAMFQGVLDEKLRREMGAHYTSEENILKVIKPLFLDDLWAEFERVKYVKKELEQFHNKIASLKFLDPACGCGNFLIIAYRELRKLEYAILDMWIDNKQSFVFSQDMNESLKVNINQFYGIEIEEFPCRVAQVGMWLMEHKMNMLTNRMFGEYIFDLPLKSSATIVCANALTMDWNNVVSKDELSYIIGNPPFVGARVMSDIQKSDMKFVFGESYHGLGNLDYVCAWYRKSADMMKENHNIRTTFVSTNSISQGVLPFLLWRPLENDGFKIDFAYHTFKWTNEAPGVAIVHCVIIGFSYQDIKTARKILFDEQNQPRSVKNINAYLKDESNIYLDSRTRPLCNVPSIGIGNQPIDGGFYLFTENEMKEFIAKEPKSANWFHPWFGADEFINGYQRYCLWLKHCPPNELKQMKECLKRIEAVKQYRLKSKRKSTLKLAKTPTEFQVENIPESDFLLIPAITSEKRLYIPIGFMPKEVMCSNRVFIMPNATLYHFGVLSSIVHNAWNRAVCGRLEMRYNYSKDIVYNNFPWPTPTDRQKLAIEKAAQAVLDVRNAFPNSSPSDLYEPNTMPSDLVKAHEKLDKAVIKAYNKDWKTESEIVADLMKMYQVLVDKEAKELAEKAKIKGKRGRKRKSDA